jgi:hypothetical protein
MAAAERPCPREAFVLLRKFFGGCCCRALRSLWLLTSIECVLQRMCSM